MIYYLRQRPRNKASTTINTSNGAMAATHDVSGSLIPTMLRRACRSGCLVTVSRMSTHEHDAEHGRGAHHQACGTHRAAQESEITGRDPHRQRDSPAQQNMPASTVRPLAAAVVGISRTRAGDEKPDEDQLRAVESRG